MRKNTKIKSEEGQFAEEAKRKEKQIWLTVYSDMTTNLSLFFLILFAFTRLSAPLKAKLFKSLQRQFQKARVEEVIVETKQEELKEKKDVEELKRIAYVEETQKEIKITLPSPVLFDLNKAELKQEAKNILSQISKILKENDYPVVVEGHTDNLPILGGPYRSNWHLSSARAFSVIEFFIKQENIPPDRFSAMGYGEYKPVAPNDTEENRAKNRRIEIVLIKI
ncbi:MAG: flagellar motor protein MotB [Endomicrobiia bacterium]